MGRATITIAVTARLTVSATPATRMAPRPAMTRTGRPKRSRMAETTPTGPRPTRSVLGETRTSPLRTRATPTAAPTMITRTARRTRATRMDAPLPTTRAPTVPLTTTTRTVRPTTTTTRRAAVRDMAALTMELVRRVVGTSLIGVSKKQLLE